jgi:hypothetical protein
MSPSLTLPRSGFKDLVAAPAVTAAVAEAVTESAEAATVTEPHFFHVALA